MELYGLIGRKLSHSFSAAYFQNKFEQLNINANYRNFEIESVDSLQDILLKNPELRGLNVTIPFKKDVLPFLDLLDKSSSDTGSVNTIKFSRKKDNSLFLAGYNTDVIGFEKSIESHLKPWHQHALILGTGGSAKAAAYVLKKLGIAFTFVSRNPND